MSRKITFFNAFHNGDIHVSRSFISAIIRRVSQNDPSAIFTYAHRNDAGLLADIPNLGHSTDFSGIGSEHDNLFLSKDQLYINTWYAQQHHRFMNAYGLTMDALYAGLDGSCKDAFGFSLDDISGDPTDFFPSIDWSSPRWHLGQARAWLSAHPEKKIFICNGYAQSGQSHNFNLMPLLIPLAQRHSGITFILTNKEGTLPLSNMVWSSDIIGNQGNDLNENAFLSEYCYALIGRATGAMAFAQTKQNMLNRKCNVLQLTNLLPPPGGKFWLGSLLGNKINYSANITVSNDNHLGKIQALIERQLA
jgi:hypothetical protein